MDDIQNLTVIIPGRPVPLQRPRINIRAVMAQVRTRRASGPLVFTPYKCKRWQKSVASVFSGFRPLDGLVVVYVWFVLKRPKKVSKFSLRPDLDNFMKNVFDGLSLSGIIEDDAWIHEYHVYRIWTDDANEQETVVHIKRHMKP